MKKITWILLFFLGCFSVGYAQVSSYSFAQSNDTYTEITGGTILGTSTTATSFDSQVWTIADGTIPFSFNFNGTDYTGCKVTSNGFITFGATVPSTTLYTPISSTATYSGAISAWGADLCGVHVAGLITGEARWEVVGSAPNREFVIQFKNWRPAYSSSTSNIPYINFQIRLAETSNVIKIVYGSNGYAIGSTSSSGTRQIGLRGAANTDYNNRTNNTSTLFTASTSGTANNATQAYNTTVATPGMPSDGLTYTWTPPVPCSGTPVAGTSSPASQTLLNGQASATLTITGQTTGVSGLAYQWEESTDGGSNWVNANGGTGATTLSYTPPVYAGTPIQYRLRITCTPSGLFDYSSVASIVSCGAITSLPWIENFATFVPTCWSLADNGDLTAGPATFGSSSWVADGFGNVGTTGAVRVNIDATGDNDWILSPLVTIPATGYELKFDVSANQWFSTSAPTTPWEADDFVEVLVSTGTTNWTVLYTYNDSNVPSNTGTTNIIDLDAYAGQTVRFAFRGVEGASNGGADIEFIVDNFEVRQSPACSNPIGLVVNNLVYNSADITWTASTGSYEYVLDNVATDPAGSGTPLSGEIYSNGSLTPQTTYYFHIRTVCPGPIYSVWSTISFTTPPVPPANDDCSGAIALTVNSDFSCSVVTSGTVFGATASSVDATACFGAEDDDVWYSFVATAASHRIVISNVAGSVTDMYHSLWTGSDCNSLSLVSGSCSDPNTSNPSGLVIGQTYYVRVNTYSSTGGQTSTFDICIGTPPPPPANDACTTAFTINSLPYNFTQDASAATNNSGYISACSGTSGMNDGVWHTFVVDTPGDVSVVLSGVTGWDPEVAVYSGACGSFTCMGSVDTGATGGGETLNLTGLAAGQYWINVGYYGGSTSGAEGPYTIDVTGTAILLSSNGFDVASFKAYPNPVKDVLNLSYSSEITSVEVFNMLGQKVIAKEMNVAQGQVDMSNLNAGNYIVKVYADGEVKTLKVIKQ